MLRSRSRAVVSVCRQLKLRRAAKSVAMNCIGVQFSIGRCGGLCSAAVKSALVRQNAPGGIHGRSKCTSGHARRSKRGPFCHDHRNAFGDVIKFIIKQVTRPPFRASASCIKRNAICYSAPLAAFCDRERLAILKGMLIGYARISTEEQKLASQLDALWLAGCELVFCDVGVSGAATDRQELTRALLSLSPDDGFSCGSLTVWAEASRTSFKSSAIWRSAVSDSAHCRRRSTQRQQVDRYCFGQSPSSATLYVLVSKKRNSALVSSA